MKTHSRHIVSVLSSSIGLLALAACGGNGGSSAPDSATVAADAGDAGSASDASPTAEAASDAPSSDGDDANDASTPAALRASCAFALGAKPADTLEADGLAAARAKVGHVIVLMKENRSFDHLFGGLAKAGKTDVELPPSSWTNADATGAAVAPFHQTNTCTQLDPEHQWDSMHADWNAGQMDGFVKNAAAKSVDAKGAAATTDGHYVMGAYTAAELPFYYWLAQTFAIGDHYHASALAGTWANRLYLLAANSYGTKDTGAATDAVATCKTIFDGLDAKGVSWGVYTDAAVAPFEYTLITAGWTTSHAGVHPLADLFTGLAAGTLPSVVFVDASSSTDAPTTAEDEHPPTDLQVGEAFSKKVYEAVVASPLWLDGAGKSTALLWTYDENGSFADHVAPPTACPAAADQSAFDRLGPRVPFALISPYARPGFVSHATHSHTSITRLIEAIWDLPAMSARDANSDALFDLFDFSAPKMQHPPTAPAAGTGGCTGAM
jgi:phospholipase C